MDWQQAHRGQNMHAVKTVQSGGSKFVPEPNLLKFLLKNFSYINEVTNLINVLQESLNCNQTLWHPRQSSAEGAIFA